MLGQPSLDSLLPAADGLQSDRVQAEQHVKALNKDKTTMQTRVEEMQKNLIKLESEIGSLESRLTHGDGGELERIQRRTLLSQWYVVMLF